MVRMSGLGFKITKRFGAPLLKYARSTKRVKKAEAKVKSFLQTPTGQLIQGLATSAAGGYASSAAQKKTAQPLKPTRSKMSKKQPKKYITRGVRTAIQRSEAVSYGPKGYSTLPTGRKLPRFSTAGSGSRVTSKKKSPMPKAAVSNVAVVYGVVEGTNTVYHGWQACGGRTFVFRQFVDAFLREIIRERKVSMSTRDAAINWHGVAFTSASNNAPSVVRLKFHEVTSSGVISVTERAINTYVGTFNGTNAFKTFDVLRDDVVAAIMAELDSERKFLYEYGLDHLVDNAAFNYSRTVSEWKFRMRVKSVCKMQNVTPADGGTDPNDRQNISANPLTGKLYTFTGGPPRVRGQFSGTGNTLINIEGEDDGQGLITFPSKADDLYKAGNTLAQPIAGGTIFSNCKATQSCYIAPGNFKYAGGMYEFSGSVRSFCKKMAMGPDTDFKVGDSHVYAFTPTLKTVVDEVVRTAFHLDFKSQASMTPHFKIRLPASNITALRNIGYTPPMIPIPPP